MNLILLIVVLFILIGILGYKYERLCELFEDAQLKEELMQKKVYKLYEELEGVESQWGIVQGKVSKLYKKLREDSCQEGGYRTYKRIDNEEIMKELESIIDEHFFFSSKNILERTTKEKSCSHKR